MKARYRRQVDGLYFATTSAPYIEKMNSALIATAWISNEKSTRRTLPTPSGPGPEPSRPPLTRSGPVP